MGISMLRAKLVYHFVLARTACLLELEAIVASLKIDHLCFCKHELLVRLDCAGRVADGR